MDEITSRIDAEWIALNAFRGMAKIATKSDMAKSTYDNALDLGGELYPELLGSNSLLRRERESDVAREYRQRATLMTIKNSEQISPVSLLQKDIAEFKDLLLIAEKSKDEKRKADQIKKKLGQLIAAEQEINTVAHTENQLIFRDAYNVERNPPAINSGKGHRDFELPDGNILRIRVLHPDKPEHISGADIIYERHSSTENKASIVAVQYKIWSEKVLGLTDIRLKGQLKKLDKFMCSNDVCNNNADGNTYRFPCCAAFLRPTDKLQKPDQKFLSSGEHLPICKIDECTTYSKRGTPILSYDRIRDVSLSSEMFEYLFNKGKIGSKFLSYDELKKLYSDYLIESSEDNVVIYAQEFAE